MVSPIGTVPKSFMSPRHAAASNWRARFLKHGMDGLGDAPRSGAPRTSTYDDAERLITLMLETKPSHATHLRRYRSRAPVQCPGVAARGQSAVSRIWRAFVLQPHRSETFKLSADPFFIEEVRGTARFCKRTVDSGHRRPLKNSTYLRRHLAYGVVFQQLLSRRNQLSSTAASAAAAAASESAIASSRSNARRLGTMLSRVSAVPTRSRKARVFQIDRWRRAMRACVCR